MLRCAPRSADCTLGKVGSWAWECLLGMRVHDCEFLGHHWDTEACYFMCLCGCTPSVWGAVHAHAFVCVPVIMASPKCLWSVYDLFASLAVWNSNVNRKRETSGAMGVPLKEHTTFARV